MAEATWNSYFLRYGILLDIVQPAPSFVGRVPGSKDVPEHDEVNNIAVYVTENVTGELTSRISVGILIAVTINKVNSFIPDNFSYFPNVLPEHVPSFSQYVVDQLLHCAEITLKQFSC